MSYEKQYGPFKPNIICTVNLTDIFLVFTYLVSGLIDCCWLRAFRDDVAHHLNDEYEQWNKQKSSLTISLLVLQLLCTLAYSCNNAIGYMIAMGNHYQSIDTCHIPDWHFTDFEIWTSCPP